MVSLDALRESPGPARGWAALGGSAGGAGAGAGSSCTVLGSSSRGRLSTDDSPWRHGFQLILSEPREQLSRELPGVTAPRARTSPSEWQRPRRGVGAAAPSGPGSGSGWGSGWGSPQD